MNINEASKFKKIVLEVPSLGATDKRCDVDVIITSYPKQLEILNEEGKRVPVFADTEKTLIQGFVDPKYVEMYVPHKGSFVFIRFEVKNLEPIFNAIQNLRKIEIQDTIENFDA